MKLVTVALSTAFVFGAGMAFANTSEDAVRIATESGVCGEAPVISAIFIDAGTISATCDASADAFPYADAATLLAAASKS